MLSGPVIAAAIVQSGSFGIRLPLLNPTIEPRMGVLPTFRHGVRPMHKVLVYRSDLLPLSETFIREQILSYRSWQAVLVGMRSISALPLTGLDVRILRPSRPGFLNRLQWKLSRMRGTIPGSVVKMLRRERASLLHAHFGRDALEAWPIARALGLPMLVTLHGYDINISREWWEAGHGGAAVRRYPERLLALGREPQVRFIAVSASRLAASRAYPAVDWGKMS
jgi:hypothetical protein